MNDQVQNAKLGPNCEGCQAARWIDEMSQRMAKLDQMMYEIDQLCKMAASTGRTVCPEPISVLIAKAEGENV
jgi:hypothetical protein